MLSPAWTIIFLFMFPMKLRSQVLYHLAQLLLVEMEVWPQIEDLPISTSQVARNIGIFHMIG
jgi:hypothetical protein